MALWSELAPDLDELDDYGGGDYATAEHVAGLLDQIRRQLDSRKVGSDHRRKILDRVLPFIKSGNAGMDDMLYEVAYAACYDDSDLRGLAEAFEVMQGDWELTNLMNNATRKEYARKAKVMVKVRHMLVDVLGNKVRWNKYAAKVKQDNIRRPVFQEEFARMLPGWRDLK